MKPFLSIDPGLEFGWAYWAEKNEPANTGVFIPDEHPDYFVRADLTVAFMHKLLYSHRAGVEKVICEWPAFMDYERGKVAARSGSLVKLTYMVGALRGLCYIQGVKFIPVEVNVWKGQLPKEQVNYHIQRILGKSACQTFRKHAWDAVGIGLHHLGRF